MFATTFDITVTDYEAIYTLTVDGSQMACTAQWLFDHQVSFRFQINEENISFIMTHEDMASEIVDMLDRKFNPPQVDNEPITPECTPKVDSSYLWSNMPEHIMAEFEQMTGGSSDYPTVITPLGFLCEYSLRQQQEMLPYIQLLGQEFYNEVIELRSLSTNELLLLSEHQPHWVSAYSPEF